MACCSASICRAETKFAVWNFAPGAWDRKDANVSVELTCILFCSVKMLYPWAHPWFYGNKNFSLARSVRACKHSLWELYEYDLVWDSWRVGAVKWRSVSVRTRQRSLDFLVPLLCWRPSFPFVSFTQRNKSGFWILLELLRSVKAPWNGHISFAVDFLC